MLYVCLSGQPLQVSAAKGLAQHFRAYGLRRGRVPYSGLLKGCFEVLYSSDTNQIPDCISQERQDVSLTRTVDIVYSTFFHHFGPCYTSHRAIQLPLIPPVPTIRKIPFIDKILYLGPKFILRSILSCPHTRAPQVLHDDYEAEMVG